MDVKQLEFTVFIIHILAEAWGKETILVYEILKDTKILDDYIIAQYDILHSLGAEYLLEDISEMVKERQERL